MIGEIYEFKREKKKIRWKLLVILFIVGLLLISFFYFLFYSGFVKVNEFKVEGIRTIDRNILFGLLTAEIIKNQSWRAFFGQDNLIFWLGIKDDLVKEKIPLLADLKLKINFWEQKVEVIVSERQFKGIWCFVKNRQCFIFDKEGVAFSLAPKAEGNLLLKINDENERIINLGQLVLTESGWFKTMFEVIGVFRKENMSIESIWVKDSALREWEIVVAEGPRFIFSFEHMPEDLAEIIKNLKNQLNFSKLYYIDFRIPGRIYYK